MLPTQDLNIADTIPLIPPLTLEERVPASERALQNVVDSRREIQDILKGKDDRLLLVIGPCSLHDEANAYAYAERLKALSDEVGDRLLLVMRAYFEKPRTTVGWRGMINDPHLDGTFDMSAGLEKARRILIKLNEMGLPAATEFLDPIVPQYTAGLISWAAIGARTTESQTHRQMASGLSMPVGFKNSTDGNLQVAVDAMTSASAPHAFLGIDRQGRTCVIHTKGNPFTHLILRGGTRGTNYDAPSVSGACVQISKAGFGARLMVDCSHANASKDPARQPIVFRDVLAQRLSGNSGVIGVMLESHLQAGKQSLGKDPSTLKFGVSITDPCIGWEETESLLREAHRELARATAHGVAVG